jgi:G:T-mismatch repair DNA endonuclease (very short patch repair protein)
MRDSANTRKLRKLGWSVRSLWECQVCKLSRPDLEVLLKRLLPSFGD